jgi:hypothetical protein
MPRLKRMILLLTAAIVWLFSAQASATTVLQMNLDQLTDRAATIVRGTVRDIRQTTVRGGGGELPALHYTVEVSEVFKGEVGTAKDVQIVEFKMLGNLADMKAGKVPAGFPVIQTDKEYLLFISPSGAIGLTTTMGLGQGCFNYVNGNVINGFNNAGLFKDMNAAGVPESGPVEYAIVASLIRAKLGS